MNPNDQQPAIPAGQPDQGPVLGSQPQPVYVSRPLDPGRPAATPEIQQRHQASKQQFPELNLSAGEYVISVVQRHPIGLISIWAITAAIIAALFAIVGVMAAAAHSDSSALDGTSLTPELLAIPALLISILVLIFGFIQSYIYRANKFILTNESVIQHIQTSLFNMREQTISLQSVEDASYTQNGIMPHLFNYGSIRLSTIGDENTYRFHYTANPRQAIAVLNNAVEDFKNGRRAGD